MRRERAGRLGIAGVRYMYRALHYCQFLWPWACLRLCGGATDPDHDAARCLVLSRRSWTTYDRRSDLL